MSLLDGLNQGAGVDPAVLAAINAQIASLQALVSGQQTALTHTTTTADDAADAITVHTGQISALAAADASHAAEVIALGNTIATTVAAMQRDLAATVLSFNAARFVPVGEVLHDANIDDAIDAAHAAALAATAGIGLQGPACIVFVPHGIYALARPHVFAAPGEYQIAVSFYGAGQNETVFIVDTDEDHTPAFTFGSFERPSGLPHTFYLNVCDFSIVSRPNVYANRIGIRFYGPVNPIVRGIRIRGLREPNHRWDECHGMQFLECKSGEALVNSQFPMVSDCDIFGCGTGIYLLQSGPTTFENVHCQGNDFAEAIVEASALTWRDGGIQGGRRNGDPNTWYGNVLAPSITTGWGAKVGGEMTGVTCSAATGRLCTLTNLVGLDMSGPAQRDGAQEYMFIELTTSGNSANERKVGGVYKVEQVLSPTSCTIRKGSNHTLQTGITAQLCQSKGVSSITLDHLYNESDGADALLGIYKNASGAGSTAILKNMILSGGDANTAYVEAQACGRVEVREVVQSSNRPPLTARLRAVQGAYIEDTEDRILCDPASYPGVICQSTWLSVPRLNDPGIKSQGTRDKLGGHSVRLRSALDEMGFCAIWDPRVTSSIDINAGKARSITSTKGGGAVIGTPKNTGIYPNYVAEDSVMGCPVIANVPGDSVSGGELHGTIPHALLPSRRFVVSIVVIARLESATPGPADPLRVWVSQAGNGYMGISFNDGQYYPSGVYGHGPYPLGPGSWTGNAHRLTTDMDTNGHVYVLSCEPRGFIVGSTDYGNVDYVAGGGYGFESFAPGVDLSVTLGGTGSNTYAFRTAFAAVKCGPLSPGECQKILDLTRNEFRVSP